METLLFVLAAAVAAAVTQGDPAHGRQSPVSDSGAWRPGPRLLWSAALCTVLAGAGGGVSSFTPWLSAGTLGQPAALIRKTDLRALLELGCH